MTKLLNEYTNRLLGTLNIMKEKKLPHYDLDEMIDVFKRGIDKVEAHKVMLGIIYAIQDLRDQMENLDNEFRGYDP